MKKIIFTVAAAVMLATPLIGMGQKYNPAALRSAVTKALADAENAKKNTKPAPWIKLGSAYVDAAKGASRGVYHTMPETDLVALMGQPTTKAVQTIGRDEYNVYTYPAITVYVNNHRVIYWNENQAPAVENAMDKAFEAYSKAYELNKNADVKKDMIVLSDLYQEVAQNYIGINNFAKAGENYEKSYNVRISPAVNELDTAAIYRSGMFYIFANDYANGKRMLTKALDLGYEADGDTYYYLYYGYRGTDDIAGAKRILEEGLKKYPGNTDIVEGLVDIYSNPGDIIPIVEKAIAEDPGNSILWSGLGNVYNKLGDADKAVESWAKAVSLRDDFVNNFRLGFGFVEQGDKANKEMSEKMFTNAAESNAAREAVNDIYEKSLAPLEKAYSFNPTHEAVLTLLKNVTFRLREREGVQAKYDKYNKELEAIKPAQ